MIAAHRRTQRFAVRPRPILQDLFRLLLREARQSRQTRCSVRPVCDRSDRPDPYRRASQPCRAIQLAIRLSWRMAFRAFRHLLDQVSPALNLTLCRRRRQRKSPLERARRPRNQSGHRHNRHNRQPQCPSHLPSLHTRSLRESAFFPAKPLPFGGTHLLSKGFYSQSSIQWLMPGILL
jgi:hypothetical protein